jgi:hypothetical protein
MDQSNSESGSSSTSNTGNGTEVGLHLTPVRKEEVYPCLVDTHLGHPTDNIPHTVELTPAEQLAPGVTLLTKDGAIIGNAIVVKKTRTALARNNDEPEPVWIVETDFGNRLRPTAREIFTMWDLGYVQDYDQWWDDRLDIIKRTVEP